MNCFYIHLGVILLCLYQPANASDFKKRELLQKERILFKELKNKLTELERRLDSRTCSSYLLDKLSATYTRWSRTTCPKNNTELVYAGYLGGSHHNAPGAASNYLCMPKAPEWDKFSEAESQYRAYVYGAEYEIADNSIHIDRKYHNHDIPCAVCRTLGISNILMLPGKTKCTKTWKKEYSGYLMANYHKLTAASQYICVDKDAERIPGSSSNKDGALLYPVEARCGSLKCPPYVNGRELPCVVCSK